MAAIKCRVKVGDRFERYEVIGEPFRKPSGKRTRLYAECRCDCGSVVEVSVDNLTAGAAMSCGCLSSEASAARKTVHGLTSHPLYVVWGGIKSRCQQPANVAYEYYGARGIAVCEEWLNDPAAFINWALANGWRKGLQVDRRDNDAGYSPGNCRIVTPSENNLNQRPRRWRRRP